MINTLFTTKKLPVMTVENFQVEFAQIESKLFGFAIKLTKNRESARDLMQDTYLRSIIGIGGFRDGTNIKAWVSTIMRNSFINDYRKNRTRKKYEQPVEDMNELSNKASDFDASSNVLAAELKAIVFELSDKYRIPFVMFYEGWSYVEIAETLQMPIGTVKSRIFGARNLLKKAVLSRYQENREAQFA